GLPSLLHAALWLLAGEGRLPGVECVARQVLAGADPQVAGRLSQALLPDQPVQAQRRPQCAQGRLGRLAFAARRLARAFGRQRRRLAEGSGKSAGEVTDYRTAALRIL